MPVAAVLGWPLEHTGSPALHLAGYRAAGLTGWDYQARPTPPAALPAALDSVRRGELAGVNLTTPHKQAGARLVDARTPVAEALGAVNTVWRLGGRLLGDNTDVPGALWALAVQLGLRDGFPPARAGAVLLGSGGMARAAAAAYRRLATARRRRGLPTPPLLVVARDDGRAAATATLAGAASRTAPWTAAADAVAEAWLVIQATTATARGDPIPGSAALPAGSRVLECNYGAAVGGSLAAVRAGGVRAVDGRGVLLVQAAAAFLRFTGRPADRGAMARSVGLGWPRVDRPAAGG